MPQTTRTIRTVYKYELDTLVGEEIAYQLPFRAVFLHFQIINGNPTIWCEVDPLASVTEKRHFTIFATGGEIPVGSLHVITTITPLGQVWHLYERVVR